ncbi:MAG: AmmeMemoRadiSam system protein B [Spirochaetota bacterium]
MGTYGTHSTKIREPIASGLFYPEDESELRNKLEELFAAGTCGPGSAVCIVSPHAGYEYSGRISAAAVQSASKRKIRTAIILGPTHRESEDAIYLSESRFFKTPLGAVQVDEELNEELLDLNNRIIKNDVPHLEEHCIEVQLPFIQYLFPGATVLPLLLGKTSFELVKVLSQALKICMATREEYPLFLVSSNMSAYLKADTAEEQTRLFLKLVADKTPEAIIKAHLDKKISACGAGCLAAVLGLNSPEENEHNIEVQVLEKGSSGEYGEEKDNVVHYAAISIHDKRLRHAI